MKTSARKNNHSQMVRQQKHTFRMTPITKAIALILATGVIGTGTAHAQQVFSRAWYGKQQQQMQQMRATGVLPNGQPITNPQQQQQQSREQLQRSWGNVNRAAQALAASLNAQQIARTNGGNVPVVTVTDGVGGNGLVVDLSKAWQNATLKDPVTANGQTKVTIEQDAARAIAYWDSFNVGKNTHVHFDQQGNSDWAILNKVSNSVAPSQIQGKVTADGTVLIVNNNGVVFTGTSQINVRNLVAAAATISDSQFMDKGIYVDTAGTQASFTNALGNIFVDAGAQITTHLPSKATQSGGYVLLLGQEVHNAGEITTDKGQTTLAAGDSFAIRKGYSTESNTKSTTRGNEVAAMLNAGSTTTGQVVNTGIIKAATGDITLTGHDVVQNGVAIATTSTSTRGTIHLLNSASDTTGKVTLGKDSVTMVLLDTSSAGALDSQKDAGKQGLGTTVNGMATGNFDNLGTLSDFTDLSRIEITSGNTVDFESGSLTLATGGQVAVTAKNRTLVRDGAEIDVSGAVGVAVAMEANSIKVNIQGNEQRDASVNRDSTNLNNNDVWVDIRDLIFVPAGTNGYETDRWYTAGGLLEVSGYLATTNHSIGEWMAQGGTVQFSGKELVTQAGSNINLSGGTIDVATGYVNQTWLKGTDGKLYEVSSAPGDLLYTGVHKGFEVKSERYGVTKTYYNPLMARDKRLENGYTVGRDAGKLIVSTTSAVLEGDLTSDTFQGVNQTEAAQKGLDSYHQSHNAVARGAQLIVGNYTPFYDKDTGLLHGNLQAVMDQVQLTTTSDSIATGLDLTTALPTDRQNTLVLNTEQLNGFELGALKIAANDSITVDGALTIGNSGNVTLYSAQVDVNESITTHSGEIHLGNILNQYQPIGRIEDAIIAGAGSVVIGANATLDTSGVWRNLHIGSPDQAAMAAIHGGSVSIRSAGNVVMEAGSLIDVSSGAVVTSAGSTLGGRGGDVTLQASATGAALQLDGQLQAYGVNGGGKLQLQAHQVVIGDAPPSVSADTLVLAEDFFNKGFSDYTIIGQQGMTVVDGANIDVTMPVYQFVDGIGMLDSSTDKNSVFTLWTPPLYQENPVKGTLTQRKGASLTLQAGTTMSTVADAATVEAVVGKGAIINVDAGQSIKVAGIGQVTVDGTLNAWGGKVTLTDVALTPGVAEELRAAGNGRSIWVGENAVLDVAARAATAVDAYGRTYGKVMQGGSIVIGSTIDHATAKSAAAPDVFVVIRDGALLDASGTQAVLDIAGLGKTTIASNGGSIAIASKNGLYLDGTMLANKGGEGAAGGTLSVALESAEYLERITNKRVLQLRELIVSQDTHTSKIAAGETAQSVADDLVYGTGALSVEQINAGGFDNLTLLSNGLVSFDGDVNLAMRQSLNIYAGSMALAETSAANTHVSLSAPYVRLASPATMGRQFYISPTIRGGTSQQATDATFDVHGSLIDVRDLAYLGARGTINQLGTTLTVDRRGFEHVGLYSEGDIRLLAATGTGIHTRLVTPGNLQLTAAQIYPATMAKAVIAADNMNVSRHAGSNPAVPYSVFGELTLEAAGVLNQGGVIRAPLGNIFIGLAKTPEVNILPDSLTSVSAAGLVMPFGSTLDGETYTYNGVSLKETLLKSVKGAMPLGVELRGQSIDVAAGSVIDVSGGGDLLGAGFISGRGGSTDARYYPLVQNNIDGTFSLPELANNPVYAIVPGVQNYAPVGGEAGAVNPLVGQQITIGAGVPGLAAGTYTLMPSTYALLPGAFRVEVNGAAGSSGVASSVTAMRNGSWATSGRFSIANTGQANGQGAIVDTLFKQVVVTSADTLRKYSQYNEMGFSEFVLADAARLGVPAALLPKDAKAFNLEFSVNTTNRPSFVFEGELRKEHGENGFGSSTTIMADGAIEIIAAGSAPTVGYTGVSLHDAQINAIKTDSLGIGGAAYAAYGQDGNTLGFSSPSGAIVGTRYITLRSGSILMAPEVFLVTRNYQPNEIVIELGASINTMGQGKTARSSDDGFIYSPGANTVFAVSNGRISMLPPAELKAGEVISDAIRIGVCDGVCTGTTSIYSEGSIAVATRDVFELGDAVRYGTRHLTLAVGGINAGNTDTLAAYNAANLLPQGLVMSQDVLNRLMQGDTQTGAPALESLTLSARNFFNFYGDVSLDTYDAVTGESKLKNLILSTPAMYGAGDDENSVTIKTENLIWNGLDAAPGAVIAGGAGTGSGTLNIDAKRIEFGYAPDTQNKKQVVFDRLALGFKDVNLHASEQITANHKGTLSVYHAQTGYVEGVGQSYTGGNLNIVTPLLTGAAGSINQLRAGGNISVTSGVQDNQLPTSVNADALGAELSLSAKNITVDTAVVLPSGKFTVKADNALTLLDQANIDMSGREVKFNDVSKYSWGGDVILQSEHGNIVQHADATINVSALHNHAGMVTAIALDESAGLVDLQGSIIGSGSGYYDAGGTSVPYRSGGLDLRAQTLGTTGSLDTLFAQLNTRLNEGGITGSRSFQLKQGDLVIGNEVTASTVVVSVDNGQLTVDGTIDAHGERTGTIRLSAKDGLTLTGNAVLDAHGTLVRLDSYGHIIDSTNRAVVELDSGNGVLALNTGSRIDVRYGTDDKRAAAQTALQKRRDSGTANLGTVEMIAPRIGSQGTAGDANAITYGDIAIDASGAQDIIGARSIVVNANYRYTDEGALADPDAIVNNDAASGRPYREITADYLDKKHAQSTDFMTAALADIRQDGQLNDKLAGLLAYTDSFHLRPGVEIVTEHDLIVSGDLDLSKYRYDSLNPHVLKYVANAAPTDIAYGAGEAGRLMVRAKGDIDIYGSVNDGFITPPETQDDAGWLLTEGVQIFGSDVYVPNSGIVLHPGTTIPSGNVLNYDVTIAAMEMAAGTVLPVVVGITANVLISAGSVLSGAILNQDNSVAYAAGTLLTQDVTMTPGMKFGAGTRLHVDIMAATVTWPKGVALPHIAALSILYQQKDVVTLVDAVTLKKGAVIPSMTDVKLGGAESVDLRPRDGKTQGKNWAVAEMLPAGSQSWSMQWVAGADTEAADKRLVDVYAQHGSLRMSDVHYGMKAVPAGGSGTPTGFVWTAEGAEAFGDPNYAVEGQIITQEFLEEQGMQTMCDDFPDWCAPAPKSGTPTGFIWTAEGAEGFGDPNYAVEGQVITQEFLEEQGMQTMCDDYPDWCAPAPAGSDPFDVSPAKSHFSVLRTGTGDLDLIAARNLSMDSLYGVYTAGTATAVDAKYDLARGYTSGGQVLVDGLGGYVHLVNGGAQSLYHAWYPESGGNVLLQAGGNLTGDILGRKIANDYKDPAQIATVDLGTWLWRQGSGDTLGSDDIATAWWINFGTYVPFRGASTLTGFTGFGTLGGGNLDVRVGGDAGMLAHRGDVNSSSTPRSQGLVLAVGSTGRVDDNNTLLLTGGGDMDVRIGGSVNPVLRDSGETAYKVTSSALHELKGTLVNLRGNMQLQAGALSNMENKYGSNALDTRATNPYAASSVEYGTGLIVVPGDATISLSTRGDLVLGGVADAGRVGQFHSTPFMYQGTSYTGGGLSWFSLWTDSTAIDLFSAGGDLKPITLNKEIDVGANNPTSERNTSPIAGRFVYPSILRATAANGSVHYDGGTISNYAMLLAPSDRGQLELLASDSIYAGGYMIGQSGASTSVMPTPFQPAFVVDGKNISNLSSDGDQIPLSIFAFGANTVSKKDNISPSRFYARDGDLIGVRSGEILNLTKNGNPYTLYVGTGPVEMIAGRDIVSSGTRLGGDVAQPTVLNGTSSGNLFVHNNVDDVSIVSAGRDILYSSFNVAGPGALEITAGRHILMGDSSVVNSIGPVVSGDTRAGAQIVMQAGMRGTVIDPATGQAVQHDVSLNYDALLAAYLNADNLADAEIPLADAANAGKVVYVYTEELVKWLETRYGFSGTVAEALTYFNDPQKVSKTARHMLARDIYFTEIRAGGREYNSPDSSRYGSYLRGRNAIAVLFPEADSQNEQMRYEGDLTMSGNSGIHTNLGGNIQILTPGGRQIYGSDGAVEPGTTAGLITQGDGDIQLYSHGNILLGKSRIMTTFGGDILAWSNKGDINAGRGSKTSIVFTPPLRRYDDVGNVRITSDVPSTGAGIATLAPIAEVPAGDLDLAAPDGVIDLSEAGARASGNANLVAQQVLNADNIKVQGDSAGLPVLAVANIGALTSASAAANAAATGAQDAIQRDRNAARNNLPSVFTVRVLGFGNEPAVRSDADQVVPSVSGNRVNQPYDQHSTVQLIGVGDHFPPEQLARLNDEQRRQLQAAR
jgi:filamentous hemagglutinin family protein